MFIKNLILKNFKSFHSATIQLDRGFTSIVGPNGSGKSNVVDAIQFAFGESRVHALRAKKTSDLIFHNGNVGEVAIELDDGKGNVHVASRAVRKDGKIRYRLDGKNSKRYVIEDFLASNSLSCQNIIQQGQVQQIVEMNGKERRGLIDTIANVAEYEDKKREALSELGKVEERLREAATVLAEREGYLEELKKDKEDAEKYVQLKRELDCLKVTLLEIESKILQAEFDSLNRGKIDSDNKAGEIKQAIAKLEEAIREKSLEKQRADEEILRRSEGKQVEIQREIDDLNNKMTIAKAQIEDKKANIAKLAEKLRESSLERTKAADEARGIESQMSSDAREYDATKKILSEKQAEYNKLLSDSNAFSNGFYSARKAIEEAEAQMSAAKDKLNAIQAEVTGLREQQRLKQDELERLKAGQTDDYSDKIDEAKKAIAVVKAELKDAEGATAKFFETERKLNTQIPKLDETILLAREKTVELQTRLRHAVATADSRAIEAVMEYSKKNKGIYGTLEQLCSYETRYTVPVQVALGPRTNYVVVDTAQVASGVIDYLKRSKLGRVSFIPLDKIRYNEISSEDRTHSKHPASEGFLIDFLKFDPQFHKAFQYACGNTLLVTTLKEAQGLVGKIRFVSEDGDLGEASGLLTGGSTSVKVSALKDQKELDEWAAKLEEAKGEKESLLQSLRQLADESREARRKKAEAELHEKTLSLELENYEHLREKSEEQQSNLHAAIKKLKAEISQIDSQIAGKDDERSTLIRSLSDLNMKMLEAKEKVDVEKEQNFGLTLKEKERALSDLKISLSEYENRIAAGQSKKTVWDKQVKDYDRAVSEIKAGEASSQKAINDADALYKQSHTTLQEKLGEQKKLAGAFKEQLDVRERCEKDIQKLGNEKGKLGFEMEKLEMKNKDSDVRKAVVETKLANVNAELSGFQDVPGLQGKSEKDKPELDARRREIEPQVSALSSNVNLKAIDLYGEHMANLNEQKVKVQQLATEKEAVLAIIQEIEGKKTSTFMETFNFINSNFQKLFSQIFRGSGSLVLENPQSPFDGGLTIEARLDNKEVKYLELMSGGEKSLIALIFLFALQSYRPSSIYILDEADAALDQENSMKLAQLLKSLSGNTQFIVISHNQNVYKDADCLVGIAMTKDGSKLVEVKLNA